MGNRKGIMGYGSNGINSNGTCMNTGNQISARPSIRLYPGVSSGGSFSIFGGSAEDQARAATKIMNEVQPQAKPLHAYNNPVKPAPAPAKSQLKQPMVIDNKIRLNDENRPDVDTQPMSKSDNNHYGIGNRMLADRHTDKPVGGEVEAGYGIGNRMLADRHTDKPVGGEVEAGYGIGNRRSESNSKPTKQ